jgi:hypothetical protein
VNLDDKWINNKLNKNLPQYLNGKHISIKTRCDAQINFEEGDVSKFGFDSYEEFVKAYLFIVDNYIYPESIKIQKDGNNFLLYYECIDKKKQYQEYKHLQGNKNMG